MSKQERLTFIFEQARAAGFAKTQGDFAKILDINRSVLSAAMNGNETYLTDKLMGKAEKFFGENFTEDGCMNVKGTLPVLPVEAMAGTLTEFFQSVKEYDCEKMISPMKGVDYAIKIYGDSMSPEYPSGSVCLIKKVNEKAFLEWGKVYVLDTDNGVVIKKIRKTDKDNVVECVSINPNFQPFTIDTSFIHGWYRVLMVMSIK